MHLSPKLYVLPALAVICILTVWQGIFAQPHAVIPADTGISEVAGTAGHNQPETDVSPQRWVASRTAAIKALPAAADRPPVIVAVLDTGIDKAHEDLGGAVIAGVNFTESPTSGDIYGHGTHVAGIIAAGEDNGIGLDGVAPDCRLINVKVADDEGRCRLSALAKGIVWAVDNGALVINISIEMQDSSETLQEAIDYAWENGAVIIAAAGNGGSSLPVYPAGSDNCIAVTALKDNGELAPLANYGDWVDAAAPGFDIYSTLPGDDYGYKFGTSFAAAYVSGLSARLFTVTEDASGDGRCNDEVRQAVLELCGYDFSGDTVY